MSFVDREWYLKTYPDVAAAGADPVVHFERFGRKEGRMPCNLPALPLERDIWANAFAPEPFLSELITQSKSTDINGLYAAKVLAAFFLFKADYQNALHHALRLIAKFEQAAQLTNEQVIFLIAFEAAYKSNNVDKTKVLLDDKRWRLSNSKLLAEQMLQNKLNKLDSLNTIYKKNKLKRLECSSDLLSLDTLKAKAARYSLPRLKIRKASSPKVSIIVPMFNAEDKIQITIESLLAQTWPSTEIIIVDDCSTDNSLSVVRQYEFFTNIKIVKNQENLGAYPTRNRGVKLATGDFITIMDADDWAHPQKIEKQVLPLIKQKHLCGSLSHWVRCNSQLEFTRLRVDQSWIYRNVSSLMVRAAIFNDVGYWDELKAGADTEFYLRLIANYGEDKLLEVLPDVPLSFGRVHNASLTQSSNTHLVTQFGGPRQEHLVYARVWHMHSAKPLKFNPENVTFPVPTELCSNPEHRNSSVCEIERWRRAFDNKWYLNAYPTVNNMGLSIQDHFWRHGEAEDRSPNPLFVPSAYAYKEKLTSATSPTWDALKQGWAFNEPVSLKGLSKNSGQSIAIFAHSVSEQLFGAELSFLDMVNGCAEAGYAVFVFLPNASNKAYIETLLPLSSKIIFTPLQWYFNGKVADPVIIEYLASFFTDNDIKLAYINTIMLLEPYLAARMASVKTVTHIRELPEHDEHIQGLLRETPEQTKNRLLQYSDYFISNSLLTAGWMEPDERSFIVYNKVFGVAQPSNIDIRQPLRVCMLSSNTKKKGIEDFFEIAQKCENTNIDFNLFGPITEDVKQAALNYPVENVTLCGFVKDSAEAITKNDVVLCLSWFQESFGRTAAEAMINSRVVVGYDWGAISEVVTNEGGILVPFRDTSLIAETLRSFANNKKNLLGYVTAAKQRAESFFSESAYNAKLKAVLLEIIK